MEVTTTNLDLTEVEVQVKKFLWPMTDSRRDLSALARRQRNQNNSLGKDGVKGQEGGERKRRDRQTDGQFLDSSFRFNVPSTTRERQAGRQTDRQRGTLPDRSVSMRQNDSGKSAVQAKSENYPRHIIRTSR